MGTESHWASLYVALEWSVRLLALFVVPARRPPTAATAWLLLIFFQPIFGGIIYLFVGRPRVSRARQELIDQLDQALAPNLKHLQQQPQQERAVWPDTLKPVVQLARHNRVFPEYGGNRADMVESIEDLVEQLVRDIEQATDSVHLTFYIAAVDPVTQPVFDAMVAAARRGVEVRLLIDDFGSKEYRKGLLALEREGVRVAVAFPRSKLPRKSARFDLRNHRKLVVIDGRIGYTGSMNLIRADYMPEIVYEDLMMRLQGPVVLELQTVFVGDWYLERNIMLTGPRYFPAPQRQGDEVCLGLPSGPEYPEPVQQQVLLSLIHVSSQSIRLVTPYFVPDEPSLIALKSAAQRGVKVELILSERIDQRFVQLAQESYYSELLEVGVTIRLYPGRFLHTKFSLFDDQIALVGSANLDARSSTLNAELGLLFYAPKTAQALEQQIQRYRETARELSLGGWAERDKFQAVLQNIARLTSPLL